MEYKYTRDENYVDFASGRVLYQRPGMTNFPVRLMQEIFLRCVSYSKKKENLTLYDPCCGGGYMDTVLGMLQGDKISKIYGSDVSMEALAIANKNAALLTKFGLEQRKSELQVNFDNYGKPSHLGAIQSCEHMIQEFSPKVNDTLVEFFYADATKLNEIQRMNDLADIIFADVPYGNLVEWSSSDHIMIDQLLENLLSIAGKETVIAICSDKHQKISLKSGIRKEKQLIGKRKFEIYMK